MHVRCVQHDIRALSSGKKQFMYVFFYELLLPIAPLFILAQYMKSYKHPANPLIDSHFFASSLFKEE